MIDLVYAVWNNKLKIAGGYAALWVFNPKAAEIVTRITYGFVSEQLRTGTQAIKDIYQVTTRPKGAPRPPIIPARDRAAIARVARGGIVLASSPAAVTVGAGLTAGFLISHGIGQLPDVRKTAHIGQQYVLGAPL